MADTRTGHDAKQTRTLSQRRENILIADRRSQMKVLYDPEVDVLSVLLSDAPVAESDAVTPPLRRPA